MDKKKALQGVEELRKVAENACKHCDEILKSNTNVDIKTLAANTSNLGVCIKGLSSIITELLKEK